MNRILRNVDTYRYLKLQNNLYNKTTSCIFTTVYNNKVFLTVRQEERVIYPMGTEVGIDFIENSLLIYDSQTRALLGRTSLV